ncbi:MAG: hypothetical protein M5U23_12915 [Acidimicrobiia bacterium]|nr:hypothetical protein [Acidimicrobiia bacterium]
MKHKRRDFLTIHHVTGGSRGEPRLAEREGFEPQSLADSDHGSLVAHLNES